MIDDYGWRDTSYNGSTYYETPNVDRLARSGTVFANGYSASPVCSPTRAAIMTGKYPARLHLTSHLQGASNRRHFTKVIQPSARLALPLEEVTIAELLQRQGYRTACIGKWHLGKTAFCQPIRALTSAWRATRQVPRTTSSTWRGRRRFRWRARMATT